LKNADYIFFNPPSTTKDFGNKTAELVASLKLYPDIQSQSRSFMVTTLGSVVPLIKDYQYTLGQQEL
jgi:hypothetical protein